MKLLSLLFIPFILFALSEKVLKKQYPTLDQETVDKLICKIHHSINTYQHYSLEEPFNYFYTNHKKYSEVPLITWTHNQLSLESFAYTTSAKRQVLLASETPLVLGDYRYDLFSMLSSIVLFLQSNSDLSDSKIRFLLNTFVENYIANIKVKKSKTHYINTIKPPLSHENFLRQFTKKAHDKRVFNFSKVALSELAKPLFSKIKLQIEGKFSNTTGHKLLPIKDIAKYASEDGSYLLLLEGENDNYEDDRLFILNPKSSIHLYEVDSLLQRRFKHKNAKRVNQITTSLSINAKTYFLFNYYPKIMLLKEDDSLKNYQKVVKDMALLLAQIHRSEKEGERFRKELISRVDVRSLKRNLLALAFGYSEQLQLNYSKFKKSSLCQ